MPFDNPHQTPFGDLELLLDARRLISDRGHWVKRRFQDGNRRCLVAALSSVSVSQGSGLGSRVERRLSQLLASRAERRLSRLLVRQLPPRMFWSRMKILPARQRLMLFNDDPRTRHEDVIALVDRTIDHLIINALVCVSM
jgi:hypothetical protein